MARTRTPLIVRFWRHVQRGGPDDCWPWDNPGKRGYGYIGTGGREGHFLRAHRVAWELANGPIPDGLYVLHDCDNPACCNPTHLHLGTQADNIREAIERGRMVPPTTLRGSQSPNAKLTEADVREIRRVHAETPVVATYVLLAKRFDVSFGCINKVISRCSWKHVE